MYQGQGLDLFMQLPLWWYSQYWADGQQSHAYAGLNLRMWEALGRASQAKILKLPSALPGEH